MHSKLIELLSLVKKELKKAEKNYLQAKTSASEVAASAAHSPSQSGDRYHSQGAADIAGLRVEAIRKLKKEIETGNAHFIEKDGRALFLVRNITLIPGAKLVSVDSPVGKKLLKHVG